MSNIDRKVDGTYTALAAVGLMALAGFLATFVNIPWDWSMFMDDTLYNKWMPNVTDIQSTFRLEVQEYLHLGRFYPVKYIANLLKWRYLPNDPTIFRYFNFGVFFTTMTFASLAALRANQNELKSLPRSALAGLLVFLVGSSFLHKSTLEIISLNPIGETWVCLFLAIGAFFLFSEKTFARFFVARFFFLLVALAKEPAALVFFASAGQYCFWAWREPNQRKKWAVQAAIDFFVFAFLLVTALMVMQQGIFTKNAYFSTTPWLAYTYSFFYKLARYALWTSPFIATFFLCRKELAALVLERKTKVVGAVIFFATFALSYAVFMSTQGIVAYQEAPAAMGYFCLFSTLTVALAGNGALSRAIAKFGFLLLCLFAFSYFTSISRWERFVRGTLEPRRAVTNLIHSGQPFTILLPKGEIFGHVQSMLQQFNPSSQLFEINDGLAAKEPNFVGSLYVFEFPIYMGNIPPDTIASLERLSGGWRTVIDAKSYRIYIGKKEYGQAK